MKKLFFKYTTAIIFLLIFVACGAKIWLYRWHKADAKLVDMSGNEISENSKINHKEATLRVNLSVLHLSDEYSSGIGPHPKKGVLCNNKISAGQLTFLGERNDTTGYDTLNFIHNIKAGYSLEDSMNWADFMKNFGKNTQEPETEFYIFFNKQPGMKSAKIALKLELGKAAVLTDTTELFLWN
jgi:hypothetical protein